MVSGLNATDKTPMYEGMPLIYVFGVLWLVRAFFCIWVLGYGILSLAFCTEIGYNSLSFPEVKSLKLNNIVNFDSSPVFPKSYLPTFYTIQQSIPGNPDNAKCVVLLNSKGQQPQFNAHFMRDTATSPC